MRKIIRSIFLLLLPCSLSAQDNPLWMRYPAISPDGTTIVFSYQGDLFTVPAAGGIAIPLSISESYEYAPVWSHDGKTIAFASDRYGNFDVFIMPAGGGEARRLTSHSTGELPSCFSSDDKLVYFSGSRQDLVTNVQFPVSLMGELYSVPVKGGRVSLVLPVPALNATLNTSGSQLLYHDTKGYESEWRKHHTSSITRDVWMFDFASGKYTRLTTFNGEDRNPVFDSNNKDYYYLSEQNGSFNVYKGNTTDPSRTEAITRFTKNPVRFLTASNDNTLCFGYDGEIYTLKTGNEPVKVPVRIKVDGRTATNKIIPVNGGFTESSLSPNGKEFAFIFRGDVFVSNIDGGMTKRITNTPWQERSVSFSTDGRSLVYAAEKANNWNVYKTDLIRKEEPYFYASTILKEEPVIATREEEFQPAFSPDGKEVAYLENRVILKVINLATKQVRTIMTAEKNYSYADGDQYYTWSPDGKWFLVHFGLPERVMNPEIGLVSADGKGTINNLTLSGYNDFVPKWSQDGKMMIWGSDREGTRSQGGDLSSGDVMAMFFTKEAFDRFNLTKEEYALLKDQESKKETGKKEAAEKDKTGKKVKDETKPSTDSAAVNVVIDWKNLTDRKARLTINTSQAGDWVLAKNSEKLYYLTRFEKGFDLWVTDLRTRETKLFVKLGIQGGGMEMSRDGKFIFLFADGKVSRIDCESGKNDAVSVNTEMELKPSPEKAYMFDHIWRQMKEKFIFPDLQGVDWDGYYNVYAKFLPYITNNYDFAEMLSEMLGEMNASHTGCYYRSYTPTGDQTASLGLLYDYSYKGQGLKIAEVLKGGPADKAASKLKPGLIIEKIDNNPVTDSIDFYSLLNRKADKLTLLSLLDPSTNIRWEESIKPTGLGNENELLYKRWVETRRAETDSLSGGKIGYVHVRSMNDASMRVVFEEALGRSLGKEAIIIDTRFNGGGNIHEALSDFLSGKKYFDVVPHGQWIGYEPNDKWIKPSIVLVGESNYSDAHLFPMAYKLKNTGKTLGMPIPGTGTFVWWESQIDPSLVFGIPMGGWRTPDGSFCENTQMEPDIQVMNEPDKASQGNDQQIEAAVKELMKK
ncbi:MAG: S41 family peptidase [Bacteroidales bacterium]